MRVDDKFMIKGRGPVFTMTNEVELVVKLGVHAVRRRSDSYGWLIRGVERFLIHPSGSPLKVGESIGLLLAVGSELELEVGDEVDIVETSTS